MTAEEFLFSLVEAIQTKESTAGVDALSPKERVFFGVWTLEAEITNGGYLQFYSNSSGNLASELPTSLRQIGATRTAMIVELANTVFGENGPPFDRSERERVVKAISATQRDHLHQCDNAFLRYEENLSKLLARFMRRA